MGETKQSNVIAYLTNCLRMVSENTPNEVELVEAYEAVLRDLRSFDYD